MDPGKVLHSFISNKGNTVIFRTPTMTDLSSVYTYGNEISKEDTFIMLSGENLTIEDQRSWLSNIIEQNNLNKKIHIAIFVDKKYVGNAEIRIYDKRKKHIGEIGISIAKSYREEGIGTEMLIFIESLAKEKGLKILTMTCFAINKRALHVYKKLGYQVIGILPAAYMYKGGFEDEVLLYKNISA